MSALDWTSGPPRVLIIEDERDAAACVWDYLENRGYVVDHASDGERGLDRAMHGRFDVVVLDLGLPRLDGLTLCRRLRAARRDVPILMLSERDSLEDCLSGFEHGADDYLVKPFALREVEMRIRSLHRREQSLLNTSMLVGELSYLPKSMLAERGGRTISLTVAQCKILSLLMRESPNVITHGTLIYALWGEDGGSSASLHTHICTLRSMIDRPFERPLIQTVHGIGYRMSPMLPIQKSDNGAGSHAVGRSKK